MSRFTNIPNKSIKGFHWSSSPTVREVGNKQRHFVNTLPASDLLELCTYSLQDHFWSQNKVGLFPTCLISAVSYYWRGAAHPVCWRGLTQAQHWETSTNVWPELRNFVQCEEDGLCFPCWYGGPQEVQSDSVTVFESEDQSSTVHRVHLSAGQADHMIQWPQ